MGGFGILFASLASCVTERQQPQDFESYRLPVEGKKAALVMLKNVQQVEQQAPDLCWAACLEQALRHQGVEIDQEQIVREVYGDSSEGADRTKTLLGLHLDLSILECKLHDGSKVWARVDIDGWGGGTPILVETSFRKRILFELENNRIVLVGISLEGGGGHFVSIIGMVFATEAENEDDRMKKDDLVAYQIYDPLLNKQDVVARNELFKRFKALVYVTTYSSAARAIMGGHTGKDLL